MESLNETGIMITPNLLRVVRVFRIGRLLRFFHKAEGIKRLVFSLAISLTALFNIGAILFLIMFIYALIGMSFFANVKKTGALNDIVNFETFLNSMLLVFRLMTAAGWNDVLDPLMIEPPDCNVTRACPMATAETTGLQSSISTVSSSSSIWFL